jgi:ribosome-associated toxin RatA of RatAB toxin-antitoxin module
MNLRLLVVALAGSSLLVCPHGHAKKKQVKLDSITGQLDLAVLVPMLKEGEFSLVESYRSGRLRQVTVVCLVEAPPRKVWEVVTDYNHYLDFFPNLVGLEIVRWSGDDIVLDYELEVPGPNMEYTLHHHHVPTSRIDIGLADDEGDIQTGAWRWEFVPHAGGTQTIVVYTLYTDVREASWFIRQALKASPSLEHGLNVATGLVTVRAVKKRAEKD